jgi:hypothetical protein
VSRCEQELCVHWNGGGGCPCAVFDLKPTGADGQQLQNEPDAWDECDGCGHDREDHDRVGCLAVVGAGLPCGCVGFVEELNR